MSSVDRILARLQLPPSVGSAAPAPEAASSAPALGTDRLALASRVLTAGRLRERPLAAADRALLDELGSAHFNYFRQHSHPSTGLTLDRSAPGSASSIAAVGFSLTAHGVGVHRGELSRAEGAAYTLKTLRTLAQGQQGTAADASGHKGFFYHFLKADSGKRAGKNELSTVDTALLMAGVLFSRNFYDNHSPEEQEIRRLATQLYEAVDWNWARNGKDTLTMGWSPEEGFLPHRWKGYNEGMLMLLLGLGSPTHPLPEASWQAFHRSNGFARGVNGEAYVPFGPHFGHQYSHAWVDFRGIQDRASRERGFDWFENSRRATLAQQDYAIRNPRGHQGYDALHWGITASDGPGRRTHTLEDGSSLRTRGYVARGTQGDVDDGTLAPTAAAASIAFAPEVVLPTLHHWRQEHPELWGPTGFVDAFNPSVAGSSPSGWVGHDRLGIDQGPIALMIENHRTGFVWEVMKRDPDLRRGLERAGFRGGWLGP